MPGQKGISEKGRDEIGNEGWIPHCWVVSFHFSFSRPNPFHPYHSLHSFPPVLFPNPFHLGRRKRWDWEKGNGEMKETRNGMSPLFLSQPYLQVIPRVGKERYDMGDGMEKSREFESLWRLFPIIHPIYSFPYLSFFSLPCVSCLFHRLTTQSRKTREARRNGEVIPSFFLSRSFPPVRSLPMVSPFAPFGHSSTRLFPKLLSGAVINPRESGEVGSFIYFSSLCHLQQFTLGTR